MAFPPISDGYITIAGKNSGKTPPLIKNNNNINNIMCNMGSINVSQFVSAAVTVDMAVSRVSCEASVVHDTK